MSGFALIPYQGRGGIAEGYLRPETTAGTYQAFEDRFPDAAMRRKRLPYCMWQVGCSFRDEKNADTMRATKLRLRQFYQMEFQLFASQGSMAPYLETALDRLVSLYGGEYMAPTDGLPHYSAKTLDWYLEGLEVAGCSVRTDWPDGTVFEVAIGLDRLVALQTKGIK
jgi:glycyl-tRNA synthetase (class II)